MSEAARRPLWKRCLPARPVCWSLWVATLRCAQARGKGRLPSCPRRAAAPPDPDGPLPPAACPAPTYGHNCSQTCSCFNGGSCDPVHGQCRCGPGWMGPTCLERKPPPTPGVWDQGLLSAPPWATRGHVGVGYWWTGVSAGAVGRGAGGLSCLHWHLALGEGREVPGSAGLGWWARGGLGRVVLERGLGEVLPTKSGVGFWGGLEGAQPPGWLSMGERRRARWAGLLRAAPLLPQPAPRARTARTVSMPASVSTGAPVTPSQATARARRAGLAWPARRVSLGQTEEVEGPGSQGGCPKVCWHAPHSLWAEMAFCQ